MKLTNTVKTWVIMFMLAVTWAAVGTPTLHAAPAQDKQQLQTQGRVLPTHTVVIASDGTIYQIHSNTSGAAQPKFYLLYVAADRLFTPDQRTIAQYRTIVSDLNPAAGLLYEREIAVSPIETIMHMLANTVLYRNYE